MSYKNYLKEQYEYLKNKKEDFIYKYDTIYDKEKINTKGRKLKDNEINFIHNNLLPQQVAGDITKGKIFICILNPGFSDEDYISEEKIKNELLNQLKQDNASFFWLRKEFQETGGSLYWRGVMDQKSPKNNSLVQRLQKEFKVDDKEIIFNMLSKVMVDLELFPYHSKNARYIRRNFKDFEKRCLSISNAKNFVHKELVPNAKENKQLICFVRAVDLWEGMDLESNPNVKWFSIGRSKPWFNVESDLGKEVFNHIINNKRYYKEKIEEAKKQHI